MDYTISESFVLPSLGKIYTPEVDPKITLRSMNTMDEMKRLSPSEYQHKQMSDIIDACIVSGPNISAYDMCVGDYQFLLYRLRMVTYGSEYDIYTKCGYCTFENKDTINLDDLPVLKYNEEVEKYREFDLPMSKKHIRIKFQTPRMLDDVAARARELKKKSSDKNVDYSLMLTLATMIEEVDRQRIPVHKLETWVQELPMKDTNTIFAYATKLNGVIGVSSDLEVTCGLCGNTYKTTFRPAADFYRPNIDI